MEVHMQHIEDWEKTLKEVTIENENNTIQTNQQISENETNINNFIETLKNKTFDELIDLEQKLMATKSILETQIEDKELEVWTKVYTTSMINIDNKQVKITNQQQRQWLADVLLKEECQGLLTYLEEIKLKISLLRLQKEALLYKQKNEYIEALKVARISV
jgi:hypothetical protein